MDVATVINSEEGIGHWYALTVSVGSRTPTGQAFTGTMKKDPLAAKIYADLDEPEKVKFRASWAVKRDFQFKTEKKMVRNSHMKSEIDAGEWLTELQLIKELGGHEHEEAYEEEAADRALEYQTQEDEA